MLIFAILCSKVFKRLCAYLVSVCVRDSMHVGAKDNSQESVLPFRCVGLRDQAQVLTAIAFP